MADYANDGKDVVYGKREEEESSGEGEFKSGGKLAQVQVQQGDRRRRMGWRPRVPADDWWMVGWVWIVGCAGPAACVAVLRATPALQ